MRTKKDYLQATSDILKAFHETGVTNVGAQLLFIKICNLSAKQPCTASNAYFEEFFGLSESAIHKYLRKLVDAGLLTRKEVKDEPTHTIVRYLIPREDFLRKAELTPKKDKDCPNIKM